MRLGYRPQTSPPRWPDFAGFVRHALHSAADQVEPRADGLVRIRARIMAGLARRGVQGSREDAARTVQPHAPDRDGRQLPP